MAIINQAEIDDVHRDLGVVALLELIPHGCFRNLAVGFSGRFGRGGGGRLFQAQRVEVFFVHAGQPEIRGHGVTAAESLRDHARRARGDRHFGAARDEDRLAIAIQSEFSVLKHKRFIFSP